jgi:hypothetical protein
MPVRREKGPNGTYFVRARYRPEDYTARPRVLAEIESWRNDRFPTEALLEMRDGPYDAYTQVRRFEREGKKWIVLAHPLDFVIEVELQDRGPGRVVPLPPEQAWEVIRELDRGGPTTILEGEEPPV